MTNVAVEMLNLLENIPKRKEIPMTGILKHYWPDLLITAIVGALIAVFISPTTGLLAFAILVVLEISLSFDNAVVNAKVLERMSPFWQKLFLTVGLLIAVVGMRLLFPVIMVMVTAKLGFGETITMALHDPHTYAEKLDIAHPSIAAFGGMYLLLIFLDFIFDDEKDVHWLHWLEAPFARIAKLDSMKYGIATILLLIAAQTWGEAHQVSILISGFTALAVFWLVSSIAGLFEHEDEEDAGKPVRHGMGAFALFMYLEMQDSAFSFDGVTGAFAITSSVVIIMAGLGIGALFVRSMTVHLVRTGQLSEYPYLEHGAHWAIGALAACLLISVGGIEVPEYITGPVGVVFIVAAILHSKWESKLNEHAVVENAFV